MVLTGLRMRGTQSTVAAHICGGHLFRRQVQCPICRKGFQKPQILKVGDARPAARTEYDKYGSKLRAIVLEAYRREGLTNAHRREADGISLQRFSFLLTRLEKGTS